MPVSRRLTEQDFEDAAKLLNCDVPAVKAVAQVESSGDGFLLDGRPRILFEGHKFFAFTKGAFAEQHPTICYPKFTREFYCKGSPEARGLGELARLDQAIQLDASAAKKSCSIGKFQVMGFNFKVCGFASVDEFWDAQCRSEGDHLNAFCAFVKANGLDRHLRTHNWAEFARRYNGASFKENKYDEKLAAAFAKFSR